VLSPSSASYQARSRTCARSSSGRAPEAESPAMTTCDRSVFVEAASADRRRFLGEVWVNEKGLAAAASANPSSFMVVGGPLCTVPPGGTRAVLDRPALKLNADSLPAIARSARCPARRSAAWGAVRTKRRTPPSQTWSTFLTNRVRDPVSIVFFTVPTAGLRVLFVLVVLAHHRRRGVPLQRDRVTGSPHGWLAGRRRST
jgi:hypothetical protein